MSKRANSTAPTTLTAVLSASLPLQAGGAAQILPVGEFAGRTGRPGNGLTWKVSDARGAALAAMLNQRHADGRAAFNFDYDHQTMLAATNGQKAPASGWARRFEWRTGVGLFATDVQWTAAAQAHITAHEYRYLSPVITYDTETGDVADVLHASLTNFPDLMQMGAVNDAVATLNARFYQPDPETDLNLLESLLTALGLPAGTTETAALTAAAALKVKADKADAATTALPPAVATALGIAATAGETAALSAITALKAGGAAAAATDPTTLAAMTALQGQVAALSARLNEGQIAALVDQALKDGKLLPAQKVWATELGKANLAQLSAFIASAPKVAASLGATQSGGEGGGGEGGEGGEGAAASDLEAKIMETMGLSAAEFKAGALATAAA